MTVRWLDSAIADVEQIVEYIAEHDHAAALRLRDQIVGSVERLPDYPFMYRHGRVAGTREMLPHPNYRVVYRVAATEVQIVRVIHTRRQYP